MKKNCGGYNFILRNDQIDVLRLLITHNLNEINSYNKDWLPSRLATNSLKELLDYINDITG